MNTCVCPMSYKQLSYINKHPDTCRIRLMRRMLPFLENLSSILLHHRRGKRLFLLPRSIASICLQPPNVWLSYHGIASGYSRLCTSDQRVPQRESFFLFFFIFGSWLVHCLGFAKYTWEACVLLATTPKEGRIDSKNQIFYLLL